MAARDLITRRLGPGAVARALGEEWRLALVLVTVGAFGWWVAVPYATFVAVDAGESDGGLAGVAVVIGLLGGLCGLGFTLGAVLFATRPRRILLVGAFELAIGGLLLGLFVR